MPPRFIRPLATGFVLLFGGWMSAADQPSHADHVKGPFKTGPEVTRACLACHEEHAKDFMKTVHWTWSAPQTRNGKAVDLGKKNAINNFCLALPSNEPRCTSCHAGYGWKDASFDFSQAEQVDCLVCHDTTGIYQKIPTGAGPVLRTWNGRGSGKTLKAVDLAFVVTGGEDKPNHLRQLPLLRRRRRPCGTGPGQLPGPAAAMSHGMEGLTWAAQLPPEPVLIPGRASRFP